MDNDTPDLILKVIEGLHKQSDKGLIKYKTPVIPSAEGCEYWLSHMVEEDTDRLIYGYAALITVQQMCQRLTIVEEALREALEWVRPDVSDLMAQNVYRSEAYREAEVRVAEAHATRERLNQSVGGQVMGWFTKRKPAPAPVNSALGLEILRLMDEQEGGWSIRSEPWNSRVYSEHRNTGIEVCVWTPSSGQGEVYASIDSSSCKLLTDYDKVLIGERTKVMVAEDERRYQVRLVQRALERIKPNPFGPDTRTLAKAVLSGDDSAVRPLLDKLMEFYMDGGT